MKANGRQLALVEPDGETWVPVPEELGPYDVSDRGRVRNRNTGRVMAQRATDYDHRSVNLSNRGRRKIKYVHHLVIEAFVEPKPAPELVCLHGDDDPSNNTPDNLRWGTQRENIRDAARKGRLVKRRHDLSHDDVRLVRELAEDGFLYREIAQQVGISRPMVGHIVRRRCYSDVPD